MLPAFQPGNAPGKETGKKTRHSELHEFPAHYRLHLLNGNVGLEELPALVTMAAIGCALRTIRIRAAALRVALERHPAALAFLVTCAHGNTTY